MSTEYHVYMNDGLGGPVDYGTVIATVTSGTTWTSSALAFAGSYVFAVRAFDSASTLEESNTDARVPLILDASGVDVTAIPAPPIHLAARATAGGGAHAEWSYNPLGQGGAPAGFRVWLTAGGTPNYSASPVATVPYVPGVFGYSADATGLADGASYCIAVRAYNGTGTEGNTSAVAGVVGSATGPAAVDGLAGFATATGP